MLGEKREGLKAEVREREENLEKKQRAMDEE